MESLIEHVLIVDDEELIAMSLRYQIEDLGISVCSTATSAADAIEQAQIYRPKVVLMDVRLRGERDGVDASLVIHSVTGSRVIFITGSTESSTVSRINRDHPWTILFKPISHRQLQSAVTSAMAD